MHDRSNWLRGTATKIKIKNREYTNLVEYTRPCAKCGVPFSIFVTKKIAAGQADSNSFGLKNCEAHRRSRDNASEIENLRMTNATMKAELEGLYAQVKDLTGRLAKYELQGAMAEVAFKMPWEL